MTSAPESCVLVIGAGVIGLKTAILLRRELNVKVILYSSGNPALSTSAVAAGLWEPFHCEPEALVNRWSFETLEYLLKLEKSGDPLVEFLKHEKFFDDNSEPTPSWATALNNVLEYKQLSPEDRESLNITSKELKEFPCMRTLITPVIDAPKYLDRLLATLQADTGCTLLLEQKPFESLTEVLNFTKQYNCSCVVNCSGLGSRKLLNDKDITSGRGVLVHYDRIKDFPNKRAFNTVFFAYGKLGPDAYPAYLIPRGEVLVCGGTFLEDDYSMTATEDEVELIKKKAKIFVPEIEILKMKEIGVHVGLRPFRKTGIRCDELIFEGMKLFNNYGHGGSGWTLHYGAAKENMQRVKGFLERKNFKL